MTNVSVPTSYQPDNINIRACWGLQSQARDSFASVRYTIKFFNVLVKFPRIYTRYSYLAEHFKFSNQFQERWKVKEIMARISARICTYFIELRVYVSVLLIKDKVILCSSSMPIRTTQKRVLYVAVRKKTGGILIAIVSIRAMSRRANLKA